MSGSQKNSSRQPQDILLAYSYPFRMPLTSVPHCLLHLARGVQGFCWTTHDRPSEEQVAPVVQVPQLMMPPHLSSTRPHTRLPQAVALLGTQGGVPDVQTPELQTSPGGHSPLAVPQLT